MPRELIPEEQMPRIVTMPRQPINMDDFGKRIRATPLQEIAMLVARLRYSDMMELAGGLCKETSDPQASRMMADILNNWAQLTKPEDE
jgi:hypothetical protein